VSDLATVVGQAAAVASGEITARELIERALARIATLNPEINAFAQVLSERALAEADARDAAVTAGEPLGPLHGVPVAIKEENAIAGLPTTYGTGAVDTPAAADSEVVRRLTGAGAIVIGTTRMPEFGTYPFTESIYGGLTRNPWDTSRSTAGSSGGTAAAVASGMVAVGIGGDGGGSIRLPSSWCGLFGLKPQRGRVSAAPNTDLWRSLGTIGPLTRTVADSARVYDAIADQPFTTPLTEAANRPFRRLRIGVSLKNPGGFPRPSASTVAAVHETAELLRSLGHDVVEVNPKYPFVTVAFVLQIGAGVSDEIGRLDHPERIDPRMKTLAKIASPVVRFADRAAEHTEGKAQRFFERTFTDIDLLLTPTTPYPALPVGQLDQVGFVGAMKRALPVASFTGLWNVLGNPAAAIPSGLDTSGLPLSVQLVAPPNGEPEIIEVAAQIETARPWPLPQN
jgi:amidase